MTPRRFPPPWIAEETNACFIVRDAKVQALAYVYFEDEPGRHAAAKLAHARRGLADGGELRQAAGVGAPVTDDKRSVTRLQPHISRQSAQCRLRPQVRKYRRNAISVVMGQNATWDQAAADRHTALVRLFLPV